MARSTDWQKVFNAIGSAEAKQNYRGYHGRAHHWSLDASISPMDAVQIMAYMDAHGQASSAFKYMMQEGFNDAGSKWKFRNKILPPLVIFGGLGCAALIGSLIETNICLGFLITYAIIALWFLKNHRLRRMKSIWQGEGTISDRLDKMCALSAKSSIGVRIVPLVVLLVLAIPLLIGIADPKLYPYLSAAQLAQEGDYEAASKAYAQLGDYKDSADKRIEMWIIMGDKHMERDDAYRALDAYEEVDYAPGMAAAHYALAEEYLNEDDDPEKALTHFLDAGDYQDAPQRAKELLYAKAERLLASGNEPEAIEAFAAAGDYSDAQERISAIYRGHAEEYLAAGDDEQAAHQFMLAGDAQRADEIYARLIADAIAVHDYTTAARIHTTLGNDAGAQHMAYLEAVWHYETGNYGYAYLCFCAMADYVPAEGRSVSDYLADEKIIAGAADTLWYQPGNIVTFGSYEQDNNPLNGPEPLEWIVLDSDGAKSLIMTRYVIDHVHNDMSELYWVDSASREWLNSHFLDTFTPEEQAAIHAVKVYNGAETSRPDSGRYGGETTVDHIFLLSYQEALQYLGSMPEPPIATDYAKAQGVKTFGGACDSLLRSVDYTKYMERELGLIISDDGRIEQHSGGFEPDDTGLQPAMWVEIQKIPGAN